MLHGSGSLEENTTVARLIIVGGAVVLSQNVDRFLQDGCQLYCLEVAVPLCLIQFSRQFLITIWHVSNGQRSIEKTDKLRRTFSGKRSNNNANIVLLTPNNKT